MRRSNWKVKMMFAIAVVIGIAAGIGAAAALPAGYEVYKGIVGFGTWILVSGAAIYLSVRVFKIGRD